MEKLPFFRDRWLECYLFSLSTTYEPQYGYGREVLNKVNQMITVLDDMYDVYGTVEELELLTDAIDRFVSFFSYLLFFLVFQLFKNSSHVIHGKSKDVTKSATCLSSHQTQPEF